MITVTRRYAFCASHRLHLESLDEARNNALFGKCNNPYGHGHNYALEISVEGEIDPVTGQAVDLAQLDALVAGSVLSRYDHRYLNEELPEFQAMVPTTENLGGEIERQLKLGWTAVFSAGQPRLRRIRIFETDRNIIEVIVL